MSHHYGHILSSTATHCNRLVIVDGKARLQKMTVSAEVELSTEELAMLNGHMSFERLTDPVLLNLMQGVMANIEEGC